MVLPHEIAVVACGDDTWGCAVAGMIVVDGDAPDYLVPYIERHEDAHLNCHWSERHEGGRWVEVGP